MTLIHGTGIMFAGRGVLLRGPSGSGKSDLALRLMALGGTLVGDDYLEIAQGKEGRLVMTAPANIAGKIEVRNVGIMTAPHHAEGVVDLLLDLVAEMSQLERLPEPREICLEGVTLPRLDFYAFETSAPEKIRAALNILCEEH